jgi:hypothetical protein
MKQFDCYEVFDRLAYYLTLSPFSKRLEFLSKTALPIDLEPARTAPCRIGMPLGLAGAGNEFLNNSF